MKKDGFLPSILWPMNWPIQASTKMTTQLITNASRENNVKLQAMKITANSMTRLISIDKVR
ncbi:uncharacterized protein METZ01_LOCUS213828 [marine metagenome]|uniref:Uncharacterized protein n=1 Tax=marine metagenome TaxID=408172 RepID=A0A382FF69_9ZZZZ